MKVTKFTATLNKVYLMEGHALLHVLEGSGAIQVDFKTYHNWKDKAIFLEKGQYIKFLSDDFEVRKISFSEETPFYDPEVRVLFKHLIALGYINLMDCEACQAFLSSSLQAVEAAHIIDISSQQWFWQNPFNANKDEYQIIFDLKDLIDQKFKQPLKTSDLLALMHDKGYSVQHLVKDKLGLSVHHLLQRKRLIESQRAIALTTQSIQEISYTLGYKDPAYFNRVFKRQTGQSPKTFRQNFDFEHSDLFIEDLLELLKTYHTEQRALGFYADKMHMSVKTLSKKVRQKLNTSLGQLIRQEVLDTAKSQLHQGHSIKETAFALGFEEVQHFSNFFKHYSGLTPSQFQSKKYQ